jgi:hypothetical protein
MGKNGEEGVMIPRFLVHFKGTPRESTLMALMCLPNPYLVNLYIESISSKFGIVISVW